MKWHKFSDRWPDFDRPFILETASKKGYFFCRKKLTQKIGKLHVFLMEDDKEKFYDDHYLNNRHWAYIENWSEPKDEYEEIEELLEDFDPNYEDDQHKKMKTVVEYILKEVKQLKK